MTKTMRMRRSRAEVLVVLLVMPLRSSGRAMLWSVIDVVAGFERFGWGTVGGFAGQMLAMMWRCLAAVRANIATEEQQQEEDRFEVRLSRLCC